VINVQRCNVHNTYTETKGKREGIMIGRKRKSRKWGRKKNRKKCAGKGQRN
jgi:hypothetical protein